MNLDYSYVAVWCRSALAAGIVDRSGDGYRLAAHMDTLLLDSTSPAYVGAVYMVFEAPEMFTRFEANLATGQRMWWDDTSSEWPAPAPPSTPAWFQEALPRCRG